VSILDDYLAVSAEQMASRGQLLLGKIPRNLPAEYAGLVATTRIRLDEAVSQFRRLAKHSSSVPESVRQRQFRRLVADLDLVENYALTALNRAVDEDHRLTALVGSICKEIRYPLPAPVVTTLSTQYFAIHPLFHLLLVPLTEGHFLLHLPDLYHELAHPLLTDRHDPLIEPFRRAFSNVIAETGRHFSSEIAQIRRGRSPIDITLLLTTAEFAWARDWAAEFFCDLFGICTVGPAFAWSHLHLHAKRGQSAYSVPLHGPTSHPADHARMQAMLIGLRQLGFSDAANEINDRWNELVVRMESGPAPEYHRCYPNTLLTMCADVASEATRQIGCEIASPSMTDPIRSLLNAAWHTMWSSPDTYLAWEQNAVIDLHKAGPRIP
jgi:hypothetical protein